MPRLRTRWLWLPVALSLAGAAAWLLRRSEDDPPPPPAHVVPAGATHALLVGCTEYPHLRTHLGDEAYEARVRLHGPANDVALLRTTLRDYLGVPDGQITTLVGWPADHAQRPTRANILGHLERLARETPRGGRVVFLFAGHGSQAPDQSRGDELDRLDELMLPADVERWDLGQGRVPGSITDDEVRTAFAALSARGVSTWALFDCCHAGTMVRGEQTRMRELPPSDLGVPSAQVERVPPSRPFLETGGGPLPGVAAFYAVQSNELAPEMTLPRSPWARGRQSHGLFTFLLSRTLMRFGGALSFRELSAHLRAAYAALPYPNVTPGAEGDLDLHVSGDAGAQGPNLILERSDDGWSLPAGSLRGLTAGTRLEAFRPGRLGDPEARLGTLTLESVTALASRCRPVDGDFVSDASDLPLRAPARVLTVAPGSTTIPLAIVDETGRTLTPEAFPPAVSWVFADPVLRARFPLVNAAQADWLLRVVPFDGTTRFGQPRLALEPAASMDLEAARSPRSSGREPVTGRGRECTSETLEDELAHLFRSASLRRAMRDDLAAPLPAGLEVEVDLHPHGQSEVGPLADDALVLPGDLVSVRLRNLSYADVDIGVLLVDAADVVQTVFPRRGESPRLTASDMDAHTLGPWPIGDDVFGREQLLVVAAPRKPGDPLLDLRFLGWQPLQAPTGAASVAGTRGSAQTASPAGEGAALVTRTWISRWGRPGIPTAYLTAAVALEPALTQQPEPGLRAPTFGDELRWHRAHVVPGEGRHADLLVLHGDGGSAALVDADGDAGLATKPVSTLAREAAENTLPTEATLLLLTSGARVAIYRRPISVDAETLVLLDADADGYAERRWVLVDGSWWSGRSWGPWLSTSHLGRDGVGVDGATRQRIALAWRLLAHRR